MVEPVLQSSFPDLNAFVEHVSQSFNWNNTSRLGIIPLSPYVVAIEIRNRMFESVVIDYKEFMSSIKYDSMIISHKYGYDPQVRDHVAIIMFAVQ